MADTIARATPPGSVKQDIQTDDPLPPRSQREITLFDAVAGRGGLNGFLTPEQTEGNILPLAPEQILLGRRKSPKDLIRDHYDACPQNVPMSRRLPVSELLKAVHTYATDFYSSSANEQGRFDFRSLDETALIAIGILLEEAVKESLGENGDMVFVEPEGLENGLDETSLTKCQIKGRVKPAQPAQIDSQDEGLQEDESPTKRQRR